MIEQRTADRIEPGMKVRPPRTTNFALVERVTPTKDGRVRVNYNPRPGTHTWDSYAPTTIFDVEV